jgi:hypothetical protein
MVLMAIPRGLILIILLLLAIAFVVKLLEIFHVSFGENADASKFVMEDLHSKYPSADIAIMSITPKTSDAGTHYLEVKARVTQNAQGPCPERSHIFYNYPVQNFVPQQPEIITSSCHVCTEGLCNLAFPEEAIIASHTLKGTEAVQAYINAEPGALPSVKENVDSWLVRWASPASPYYFTVEIHSDGTILGVKKLAA